MHAVCRNLYIAIILRAYNMPNIVFQILLLAYLMVDLLPQFFFNGLLIGASYALIAVGLTMIFGIMGIANFAHGQFYMLGGCIAFFLTSKLKLPYIAELPIAVFCVVLFGALLERLIFQRLRDRSATSSVLATVGLAILLENGALVVWGPQPQPIPSGFSLMPVQLGPIFTTQARLFALVVTVGALAALHLFLNRSRFGTAMHAVCQQPEAAALVGISVDRVHTITFGLGAGLAALGGALLGAIFFVYPTMGGTATLKAFIVVILGGLGSIGGSVVGGLILGLSESLGTLVFSAYKDAVGFVLVILILLYRPDGLFKRV
jgi:branched-chain amino acid transport system permease protein